jgi:hypothetical protein
MKIKMVVRVRKVFKKEFLIKNIISKPLNINKESSNVLRIHNSTKYFENQDEIIVDYIPHLHQTEKTVKTKINYIGVVRMDPDVYSKQYGDCLVESEKLPEFVKKIPNPNGIELVYYYKVILIGSIF